MLIRFWGQKVKVTRGRGIIVDGSPIEFHLVIYDLYTMYRVVIAHAKIKGDYQNYSVVHCTITSIDMSSSYQ